jgi:hypothetical protein
MPGARFPTAQSLFETFPELAKLYSAQPPDIPSIAFAQQLAMTDRFDEALTFCAHLLPRRDALWWACKNVRILLGDRLQTRNTCLLAAEAWVQKPEEEERLAALQAGNMGDSEEPPTWLARGAGWAGGLLVSHPKSPVPVPHYMTARACRVALVLGSARVNPKERPALLRACIAEAVKLAETGL